LDSVLSHGVLQAPAHIPEPLPKRASLVNVTDEVMHCRAANCFPNPLAVLRSPILGCSHLIRDARTSEISCWSGALLRLPALICSSVRSGGPQSASLVKSGSDEIG